jgi:hypothetical protein
VSEPNIDYALRLRAALDHVAAYGFGHDVDSDSIIEEAAKAYLAQERQSGGQPVSDKNAGCEPRSQAFTQHGERLVPGHNVDRVDIAAGKARGAQLGYDDAESQMVLEYALMRWQRGEGGWGRKDHPQPGH